MSVTITNTVASEPNIMQIMAIHNQILYNLRVLKPGITDPVIATAFQKTNLTGDKINGTWTAGVWNEEKLVFATVEGTANVVDAMHNLLLLTSDKVYVKQNRWEDANESDGDHTDTGVEYI